MYSHWDFGSFPFPKQQSVRRSDVSDLRMTPEELRVGSLTLLFRRVPRPYTLFSGEDPTP